MADIGTDHGYVPIYLVKNKICTKAIALDINIGPLKRAQEHIREYQMEAYIETRQSDGLTALKPGEAETIVITGMGGDTIMKILKSGEAIAGAAGEIILQPQSEQEETRKFLVREGYHILEEDMVSGDGKFYPIMRVRKALGQWNAGAFGYDRIALKYGPVLLGCKHPVLKEYLLWQQGQKEKVLMQVRENALGESRKKNERRILNELADIHAALNLFLNKEVEE